MRHLLQRKSRIPGFVQQGSRCAGVAVFSFWATDALLSFLEAQNYGKQSLPFLLLYALIAWQMGLLATEKLWQGPRRRVTGAALALSLCIGLCVTVGRQLHESDRLIYSLRQASYIAGMASLLFVVLWRFLHWTTTRSVKAQADSPPTPRPALFWLLLLGLLLCRLPAFLALFPGVLSNDSVWQMNQALSLVPLNDGHPAVHTFLVAVCVKAARLLGIPTAYTPAVYGLAQTFFMSAVCAYATTSMLRMKVRPLLVGLAYAFFALYPIHAVYGVTMWKDVPHAGVTLLLVTCLLRWTCDPKGIFGSRARVVATVALLFFFCTLRHNALVGYLVFAPFFIWCMRAHWKRASLLCLAVLALIGAYRGGLSLLKSEPGRTVEVLSVPLQLAARIVSADQDTPLLTGEDKAVLGEILPVEELPALYNPRISDPVKWVFDEEAFAEDPGRYIALFAKLMREYPGMFLESFLLGNYGYWYPGASGYWMAYYGIYPNELGISRQGILFDGEELRLFEMALRETPGVSLLFSIGFMVWTLALAAAACWVNRRGPWPPFALLLGLWFSLMFMPVFAEYRYAYGLVLCAPVCLCTMIGGGATWTRSRY